MKRIKNKQALAMAITGFSNGFNTGMAGYQTTYTTTYSAGRAPYTQIHTKLTMTLQLLQPGLPQILR